MAITNDLAVVLGQPSQMASSFTSCSIRPEAEAIHRFVIANEVKQSSPSNNPSMPAALHDYHDPAPDDPQIQHQQPERRTFQVLIHILIFVDGIPHLRRALVHMAQAQQAAAQQKPRHIPPARGPVRSAAPTAAGVPQCSYPL